MKRISLWTVWKLRVKLWRMFNGAGSTNHHRLTVRWNRGLRLWVWVCAVYEERPGIRSRTHYPLGPLSQWTLHEALSLAARKAEWVLHPDQEPVKEPEPNPIVPSHSKVYRLLPDGKFSVDCWCGYVGTFPRCHAEQDAPTRCNLCSLAEKAYEHHLKFVQEQEAVAQ